jgi:hypothetical protein
VKKNNHKNLLINFLINIFIRFKLRKKMNALFGKKKKEAPKVDVG